MREDPVEAAFSLGQLHSKAGQAVIGAIEGKGSGGTQSLSGQQAALDEHVHSQYNSSSGHLHASITAAGHTGTNGAHDSLQGAAQTAGVAQPQKQLSNPLAYEILENLQQLRWRRIDVCFRDTPLFWFSHNHLQNTRHWMNWVGEAVCKHLAAQLNAMESQLAVANAPAPFQ